VVQKGETLTSIARRYGISVEALVRYNRISDPDRIVVGQRLRIPRRAAFAWLRRKHPRPRKPTARRKASLVRPSRAFIWPVRGAITRKFTNDANDPHKGIDIAAPEGTPIRAVDSGTVLFSGMGPEGYGLMVILQHQQRLVTVYAHNYANLVKAGDYVVRGQKIGYVGSSGNTTAPNLHFEIRHGASPLDPLSILPPLKR
jgi:murein DD-endopeptidase MepM/ murein hydrolase activator NlpD